MHAAGVPWVQANVRKYYLYQALAHFTLWSGIWIKYLTVTRGFEIRWIFLMDLPFWLLVAGLEVPTGTLGDRIGRKWMMVAGQALFAITILGFSVVQDLWSLFLVYVLWGVSMATYSGADQALIYDSLKAANRESEFARVAGRGFTWLTLSSVVGVFLGGFVADWTSLTFVVAVSAVFPALGAGIALSITEAPYERTRRRYLEDLRAGFEHVWSRPDLRWGIALGSVLMTGMIAPSFLAQPFLLEHDVSTALFGVFQAPLTVAAVGGSLVAWRLMRSPGPPLLFLGTGAALIGAFFAIGALDHTAAFAFFLFPTVARGILRPAFDTYVNERTPSGLRATVLSILSLGRAGQMAIFEPVMGFAIDWTSVGSASLLAGAWFLLLVTPLWMVWNRAHGRGPPEAGKPVSRALAGVAAPG